MNTNTDNLDNPTTNTAQNQLHISRALLFFVISAVYHELFLRIMNTDTPFIDIALFRIVISAIALGILAYLAVDLIPSITGKKTAGLVITALITLLTCIQYCSKSYFKTYFTLAYMGQMTGDVLGSFFRTMLEVIAERIPFLVLAFIPLVIYIIFMKKRSFWYRRSSSKIVLVIVFAVLQAGVSCMGYFTDVRPQYTYNFSAVSCIPEFGELAEIRLEAEYAVFGTPDPVIRDKSRKGVLMKDSFKTIQKKAAYAYAESLKPVIYDYNVTDIDFNSLKDSASDSNLRMLDDYFAGIEPSQQNEYTGLLKGKNLIFLSVEAMSPYIFNEELTPTLYRLANNGFIFTDYYQPAWNLSTTGGEFANLTGIIPTWYNGGVSPRLSSACYMPYALGNMFKKEGYVCKAWHSNVSTFYERDKTHPNFGYDFVAADTGLDLLTPNASPASDLEMIEATADSYIDEYLKTGTPFHAYYMTWSGHGNYVWENSMSAKNRTIAEEFYPDASSPVQAYIACSYELEAAMKYLMKKLEEANILEDTVIVMSADHYPYVLAQNGTDYYPELSGINDTESDTTRYRNTLVLWCGSMEGRKSVTIDTPCSSIDIAPTLCNLFGLEYDSRLYIGHDIMATNYNVSEASTSMPLVILPVGAGYSWETAAGLYDACTGVFTPNEGVTVEEGYVDSVKRMVEMKYSYSGLIIGTDYYGHVFGVNNN